MRKMIKEFITHWGPSLNNWGEEKRSVIERDLEDLKRGQSGGRKMKKIGLDDIFVDGVVTGVDMENGYLPLVLYGNDDLIIEVANCDAEQGGYHRNMGADEWAFQYKGSRTLETECGDVTINEGEMTVIPRGVAHRNNGFGPNIEITIYTRNPLKRFAPDDPETARQRMKIKDGVPVMGDVKMEDGIID